MSSQAVNDALIETIEECIYAFLKKAPGICAAGQPHQSELERFWISYLRGGK